MAGKPEDLNGRLDGEDKGNISGYGTFSVSFNDGTSEKTNLTDYYEQHRYGTTYTFKDIVSTIGHTYKGVVEGSLTGTITNTTNTRLDFVTNNVYVDCDKAKPGDVYIKINGV